MTEKSASHYFGAIELAERNSRTGATNYNHQVDNIVQVGVDPHGNIVISVDSVNIDTNAARRKLYTDLVAFVKKQSHWNGRVTEHKPRYMDWKIIYFPEKSH